MGRSPRSLRIRTKACGSSAGRGEGGDRARGAWAAQGSRGEHLVGDWTAPWPPHHMPWRRTQSGTEFALEKVGQGSVRSWGQSKPGDGGQG